MKLKNNIWPAILPLLLLLLAGCHQQQKIVSTPKIDRKAVVDRHRIVIEETDSLDALSVGNGEFAMTVDVSGLQSFPEYYENGMSLGTQSQWGWHSVPNDGDYRYEEVLETFETCNDHEYTVATQHKTGRKKEAADYLRSNPHRLHLGLIGLEFSKKDGTTAEINDLTNIRQELDMWTGSIMSTYNVEGRPVNVELFAHQEMDAVSFKIESPMIESGDLQVKLSLPYGKQCHVCPGYDFDQPNRHTSSIENTGKGQHRITHSLDKTTYYIDVLTSNNSEISSGKKHIYRINPDAGTTPFTATIRFQQKQEAVKIPEFNQTRMNSIDRTGAFWESGAAIDFSQCTDSRAQELERRIVLSQYLTKIQCAGSLPPQETGLTFNSWYGKFHLEMHWWHGVHFALWNRINLLEKSLDWYTQALPEARNIAKRQGFEGVRWQKMTGPGYISSPSSVGEFLAWQQPHPIYYAELIYRQKPDSITLNKYKDIVFETADFMASFAFYNEDDGYYHLCHPLIPAQEIFHATETDDPPFEVAYWHFALTKAQEWRHRLGLEPKSEWQSVIDKLVPLHTHDGFYLPAARAVTAYTDPELRRDHPIVTGAYGMLPGTPQLDTTIMKKTFESIMGNWNWETTWGWDYPMLAMCAARLGQGESAINALLLDVQKNTYLTNGHNYQDQRLRIYLPGNGGILTAVAMMAAGWDGAPGIKNPGFPQDGSWNVLWEGFEPMP